MAVTNPRSRTISVRLSEEEYSVLKRLCLLTGARSASDLTRDAMRSLFQGMKREDSIGNHLEEFRIGMRSLEKKLEQLEATVAKLNSESSE
jgi:Arc/MetJ-type ribon-helix-helix transcriptional regulator